VSAQTKRTSPWRFFALAYGWSWLFWLPAALFGLHSGTIAESVLHALGGIGPLVSAVVLTYTEDGVDRGAFWQRLIDVRRIGARWYAVILVTPPVLMGLAALLDRLAGGVGAEPEGLTSLAAQPWSIAWFALFGLIFGPLPEEIGWRGYALDRLQARSSALRASLVLGVAWALWHLPLFLIDGTYQSNLGLGTRAFWLFLVAMVPQTVLMTWIYNHCRQSTLSAVLFHWAVNATGELFALSARAEVYQCLLWIAAAAAVTAVWGPGTLTARSRSSAP
jgi:membrane protease YdiL (CAAX protease family)